MNISPRLVILGLLAFACNLPARAAEPKTVFEPTEWLEYRVYHAEKNDRPRVLLIGDSISGGYFDGVAKALEGKAYVSRLGSSKPVCHSAWFDEVKLALSQHPYAVIHFNSGLHGWGYTEEEYARDLAKAVAFLKANANGARLVWASSTQIRTGAPKFTSYDLRNERVKARNKIAAELMAQEQIPVNDLYTLMEGHPNLLKDGIHYQPAGNALIIPQVTRFVVEALKTK